MQIIGRQIFQELSIGKSTRNTLTFLPDDFMFTDRVYPLLMVHPGSGEVAESGGINALIKNGIPKMIADGWNPYVTEPVDEKFIVFSVQQNSKGYALPPDMMLTALDNNKLIAGRFRRDAIFVTGLSLGACATCFFFENGFAERYLAKVAGLIPMSGVELGNQDYNFDFIKKNPIPVWAFCGTRDTASRVGFAKRLEQNIPGIIMTWYTGGHGGWIDQYENARHDGMGVLEWCAHLVPRPAPGLRKIDVVCDMADQSVLKLYGPVFGESVEMVLKDKSGKAMDKSIVYTVK